MHEILEISPTKSSEILEAIRIYINDLVEREDLKNLRFPKFSFRKNSFKYLIKDIKSNSTLNSFHSAKHYIRFYRNEFSICCKTQNLQLFSYIKYQSQQQEQKKESKFSQIIELNFPFILLCKKWIENYFHSFIIRFSIWKQIKEKRLRVILLFYVFILVFVLKLIYTFLYLLWKSFFYSIEIRFSSCLSGR